MHKIKFTNDSAKTGYNNLKPHQKKRLFGFLNRHCNHWISKQKSVTIEVVAESGDNNSFLIVGVQTPFPEERVMYLAMRKSKYPGAVMTFGRTTDNLWPLIREQRKNGLVFTLPYGGIKRTCGSKGEAPTWKEVIESALRETMEEGGCVITEESRSRVLLFNMEDQLSPDNIWILSDLVCAISVNNLQFVQTQPESDELLSVQLVRFPDFVKTVCESGKYQPNNDNPIPRDLTLILAAEEWFEWGKLFLFDPDKTVRYLLRLSDILKTRHAPTRRHLITMPAVVSSSGEILRPETRTVHQFQVAKRFPHHGYNFYMNHSPARIILAELFREDPQRTIRELEEISRIPDRAKLIPKHILEELRKRRETTK